jgi:hypothetical protein
LGHAVPLAPGSGTSLPAIHGEDRRAHRDERSSPSRLRSSNRHRRSNSRAAHAEPSSRNASTAIRG